MHAVACRTVTIRRLPNLYSQPDLPTGIFHCHKSQIWRFSKAFGSESYRLAVSGVKHLATMFSACSVIEISKIEWVNPKPRNGKTLSRTKKLP